MQTHDIVIIGASAGGVEAVAAVASHLPRDLAAAVFVVVHFPPTSTSMLPAILNRAGKVPAAHAVDGETIEPGRVYVAVPDFHMLLEDGRVRLVRGARENSARPAIDPLMRTAARAYGPRVIGVILSGTLDDGTAGLRVIQDRGGLTIVQDPDDALFGGMPRSAVENVAVDAIVPLSEIAAKIVELVNTPVEEEAGPVIDRVREESEIELRGSTPPEGTPPGEPSSFACPECHGVLWEINEGQLIRFRCRVGHAYSVETLLAEQSVGLEAVLWTALRALEESAALSRRLAERAAEREHALTASRFTETAIETEERAAIVRAALMHGRQPAPASEQSPAAR